MQEGDTVGLAPPCGTFMAPGEAANEGAVLLTAGIGITPAWAMVQNYGADVIKGAVHVDKSPTADGLRNKFVAAGVNAQTYYTGDDHKAKPDMAAITAEMVAKCGVDPSYYVVGPAPFMEDVESALKVAGVKNVYSEV
jgi:ferredoxin-NADP reductase